MRTERYRCPALIASQATRVFQYLIIYLHWISVQAFCSAAGEQYNALGSTTGQVRSRNHLFVSRNIIGKSCRFSAPTKLPRTVIRPYEAPPGALSLFQGIQQLTAGTGGFNCIPPLLNSLFPSWTCYAQQCMPIQALLRTLVKFHG